METSALLYVKNLRVVFNTRYGQHVAVQDLSFSLNKGEVLGIVGESGSGKSVACYSLLGLIPMPPGKIEGGEALLDGVNLLAMNEKQLRSVRSNKIAMIFQDPMTCLNPNMRVRDQLTEVLHQHREISKAEAISAAVSSLEEVGIRDAEKRIMDYPHQFSGGMRQRVMIAMALLADPDILIADEPTTALDVTVQAQILSLIKKLQKERNLAVIFITHDLAVASQMADKIVVMEKGYVVEQGTKESIFSNPQKAYTKQLLSSVLTTPKHSPRTYSGDESPLVSATHIKTWFPVFTGFLFKKIHHYIKGVDDISLSIYPGEILGLVGESGSGKSTLGRSLIRLIEPNSGEVLFETKKILSLSARDLKKARADFQMIFQDPYASLNPRKTVFQTLSEPLLLHKLSTSSSLMEDVGNLMDDVGLDRRFMQKYPHEFSGGQRQRIAIARAVALKPKLIIADEPVSALDVTIRAQIIELLLTLTRKHNLTILFISHDMSVVRFICDRVIVMQKGKLVEEGLTEDIFNHPKELYTQQLLAAVPHL